MKSDNNAMMWLDKPYHSLDYECKKLFGEKIYKIAVDAGMTCPNRDGSLDTRGCIFCSEGGSGDFASPCHLCISDQIAYGKTLFRAKQVGKKFIVYFQSYTNTYASVERLRELYSEALQEEDVVGISIGTRADCLPVAVISLLSQLKAQYPDKSIWVEIGLQSMHEQTAKFIRRGYPLSTFEKAVQDLQSIGIPVIVHIILGLPGETNDMILDTCRYLNRLSVDGIKLQLLHILQNTDLYTFYQNNPFEIYTLESYIDLVISCLEVLSPDITIHRVTGDGPKDLLVEPKWSLNKRNVLNTLIKQMKLRNTWQGKDYQNDSGTNHVI